MFQLPSSPTFDTTTLNVTAALLVGTLSTALGLRSILSPSRDAERIGLGSYGHVYPVPQPRVLISRTSFSASPPSPSQTSLVEYATMLKPSHTHTVTSPNVNPLMLACGMRNISLGLAQFAFAYQRNWSALRVIWLCGVVIAFGDGVLVRRFGGRVGESEEGMGKELDVEKVNGANGSNSAAGACEKSAKDEWKDQDGMLWDGSQREVGGGGSEEGKGSRGSWAEVCGHWIPGLLIMMAVAWLGVGDSFPSRRST